MTKAEKKALVASLKKKLAVAQERWNKKEDGTLLTGAYCYGYLEGVIKAVIDQLEE
jgi:hypothetical protein